ncbi:MAG TPA: bacillithiol biosynthesis cysteine-adding enzyme BshC [Verrucomicrobiae bacterium]|nr:bacillithiol biosynthesis cysteine-adding enzyme BshC [Verrucomicrobiae bacterium]
MKAHCLPFSQIPHTTRLFSDYLAYSPEVQQFYPRSPYFAEWLKDESAHIDYPADRRGRVAEILERQNRSWNASEKTFANIERLRHGAAAIVTGQQVGLFGGPMFSIYKALSAVKLAEEAMRAGVETVPVFWLATYDHDLAEVNHVGLPTADGRLQTITTSSHGRSGAPVSSVLLNDEIAVAIEQAANLLGDVEATHLLRESYRPGESLGTAFARLYASVFRDYGVIVLDASDAELHRIAKPIYVSAVKRAGEIAEELLARGRALEAAGYHQQVKVTESSVLLFTMHDGARTAIHRRVESDVAEFVIGGEDAPERISQAELVRRVDSAAEHFSPNVLLRPVIEDYLLPTLAYTGGAAEAAYFAQAGVVYRILLGRITPVLPRYSATIVEPKMQRLLERYQFTVLDVFGDFESLRQKLASHSLPEDLLQAFDEASKSLEANLSRIKEKLSKLDRTLVDAAETARSKMEHQMEKLHSQAARAEAQKGELLTRHAETLINALYPEKGLQERSVGGIYFLARYGRELLDQIYQSIHTDCHDHQVLEL